MENQNWNQPSLNDRLANFDQALQKLAFGTQKLSDFMRKALPGIDRSVEAGVPLDQIVSALNATWGGEVSLSAFKSALHRARKQNDARRTLGIPLDAVIPSFEAKSERAMEQRNPTHFVSPSPFSNSGAQPPNSPERFHHHQTAPTYAAMQNHKSQEWAPAPGSLGTTSVFDAVQALRGNFNL